MISNGILATVNPAATHADTLAHMPTPYARMHGAGNRILVVDRRTAGPGSPDREQLLRLADESSGPGFDQMMWLSPPVREGSAAAYRVFNCDGSEVQQCGNGIRCVARFLATEATAGELTLDGPAGPVTARLLDDGRVAVNMGAPIFDPQRIPFLADHEALGYELDVGGREYRVAVLSMGNPHCVLEVDETSTAPVETLGPLIERHARFPERVNAGFRTILDEHEIDLRVYERGAGETLACGTGACAAVVAGRREGRLDETVTVNLPGGQLVVSWRGPGAPVWLTGSAELIDEGILEL